jgi:hypothetical protein
VYKSNAYQSLYDKTWTEGGYPAQVRERTPENEGTLHSHLDHQMAGHSFAFLCEREEELSLSFLSSRVLARGMRVALCTTCFSLSLLSPCALPPYPRPNKSPPLSKTSTTTVVLGLPLRRGGALHVGIKLTHNP